MTACRVRCGRVEKGRLCSGELADPLKGLELSVVTHASPYQQAEGSAVEARDDIQDESEEWSSSKDTEAAFILCFIFFPFSPFSQQTYELVPLIPGWDF